MVFTGTLERKDPFHIRFSVNYLQKITFLKRKLSLLPYLVSQFQTHNTVKTSDLWQKANKQSSILAQAKRATGCRDDEKERGCHRVHVETEAGILRGLVTRHTISY